MKKSFSKLKIMRRFECPAGCRMAFRLLGFTIVRGSCRVFAVRLHSDELRPHRREQDARPHHRDGQPSGKVAARAHPEEHAEQAAERDPAEKFRVPGEDNDDENENICGEQNQFFFRMLHFSLVSSSFAAGAVHVTFRRDNPACGVRVQTAAISGAPRRSAREK